MLLNYIMLTVSAERVPVYLEKHWLLFNSKTLPCHFQTSEGPHLARGPCAVHPCFRDCSARRDSRTVEWFANQGRTHESIRSHTSHAATCREEIRPGSVLPRVEVIRDLATATEAQHRPIEHPVVADEEAAAGFENLSYDWPVCIKTHFEKKTKTNIYVL